MVVIRSSGRRQSASQRLQQQRLKRLGVQRRSETVIDRERKNVQVRAIVKETQAKIVNMLSGSKNLNELESLAKDIFNKNRNNVDFLIRDRFSSIVKDSVKQIKAQQKALNTNLVNKLKSYEASAKKYDSKGKEARKKGEDSTTYDAKEFKYDTLVTETKKLLRKLETGNIYKQSTVTTYLSSLGSKAERSIKKKAIAKKKSKDLSKLNSEINTYINNQLNKGNKPSEAQLRSKFGIRGREARLYYNTYKEISFKTPEVIKKVVPNLYEAVNPTSRDLRAEYNQLRKALPTGKDFRDLKNRVDPLDTKSFLTSKEDKDLKYLNNLSFDNYKFIASGRNQIQTEKFNKAIGSVGSFFEKKARVSKINTTDLIKKTESQIVNLTGWKKRDILAYAVTPLVRQGKVLILKNQLKTLRDNKLKGKTLTAKDYKAYSNAVKDIYGIKGLNKASYNKIKGKNVLSTLINLRKFTGNIEKEAFLEIYRDAKFLTSLYGKFATKSIRNSFSLVQDIFTYQVDTYKALKNKDKSLIFKRTRSILNKEVPKVKGVVDVGKFVVENPALASLVVAIAIDQGVRGVRSNMSKNPAKAIGFAVSFFLDDIVLSAGAKGLSKLTFKAKDLLFSRKINKWYNKIVDPSVKLTDFGVEAINFKFKNPRKVKDIIFDSKGNILKTTFSDDVLSKQLTLIKPNLASKLDNGKGVTSLGNNLAIKVKDRIPTRTKKLSDFGLPRSKQGGPISIDTSGFKFEFTTLDDGLNNKLNKYFTKTYPKLSLPKSYGVEIVDTGRSINVVKKGRKVNFDSFLRNKKGQIRPKLQLITKQETETGIKVLRKLKADVTQEIITLKKLDVTNSNSNGLLNALNNLLTFTRINLFILNNLKLSKLKPVKAIKLDKLTIPVLRKQILSKIKTEKSFKITNDVKKDIGLLKKSSLIKLLSLKRISKVALKQKVKLDSKKVTKVKKKAVKKPKLDFKLNYTTKIKRNEVWIVNGRVKSKGKIKLIKLETTLNRGLRYMIKLIDNTTARSFDLILVSKKKAKDIKKPNMGKFRLKVSKSGKVLRYVEKIKYAIDTKGEKRGLKVGKLLKRSRRPKKIKSKKSKSKKRSVKRTRKTRSKSKRKRLK